MTKLLKQVYKTYEGARKRAAFENGVASFEFKQGYKAKLYHYSVVEETNPASRAKGNSWRVQRSTPPEPPRDHYGQPMVNRIKW